MQIKNKKDVPNGQYDLPAQYMCANFVFDLNGSKGPNKAGKDIGFITAIYPNNPDVVAPDILPAHGNDSSNYRFDDESSSAVSASAICKAMGAEYRLPTITDLMAISYNNRYLLGLPSLNFWSGSATGSSHAWGIRMDYGIRYVYPRSQANAVRCVKR